MTICQMPDCNRQTANALTRLCIHEVESECPYLPLSNYLYYLIETAMMEERRFIAFGRHFAASMSILTGRNIATAGEFDIYLL